MTGVPTVKVLLANPLTPTTFDLDISAYVRMVDGVSIKRGASDEFSSAQPGSLTLTLENPDGRFTLGSGLAATTYNLVTDQPIRVVLVVAGVEYNRFDGYVEAWPTEWTNGSARQSRVKVTAYDTLSRLARRKLRSVFLNEVLRDKPMVFLPLSDATSRVVGDYQGGQFIRGTIGTGTAPTYGVTLAGANGLEFAGCTFQGGKGITARIPPYPNTAPNTMEVVFQQAAAPGARQTVCGVYGEMQLTIGADGKAQVRDSDGTLIASTTGSVCDGTAHHLAATITNRNTYTLYVDGVAIGSGRGYAQQPFTPMIFYVGFGSPYAGTVPAPSTASMAAAAVYGATLSAADIARHSDAALNFGGNTETAVARVQRIARYANVNANVYTGTSATVVGQELDDVTVLDALNQVAAADGGVVFVNKIGQVEFFQSSKVDAITSGTDTLTLSASRGQVLAGISFPGDKQYLGNVVTGALADGPTITLTDTVSVAQHEAYPVDLGVLALADEVTLRARLQDRLDRYAQPNPLRINTLPITLIDRDNHAAPTSLQQAFALTDLYYKIRVRNLPAQAPASSLPLLVVGYSETVNLTSWEVEFNTVPAGLGSSDTYGYGNSGYGATPYGV